jgi:hypothetical protein
MPISNDRRVRARLFRASVCASVLWATGTRGLQAQGSQPVVPPLATHDGVQAPPTSEGDGLRRTRLYLKDGSFQVVMRYRVQGNLVHYISAERGGAEEEIPLLLVDLPATERWASRQAEKRGEIPAAVADAPPPIDPELLKEEAEKAAMTPEVAKDLRLPEDGEAFVLDIYHGGPELIPLVQSAGDLNRQTAHNVLKAVINPRSSEHTITQIKGERADVQMHVPDPVFYLRVGDPLDIDTGHGTLVVDTHGASGNAGPDEKNGGADSRYVMIRVDVVRGARQVTSFRIADDPSQQPNVVAMRRELLPGGHWLRLKPVEPLDFGEYALLEVLSDRVVNLDVWDFGVHPTAPENRDAILPEARRPIRLERRRVGAAQPNLPYTDGDGTTPSTAAPPQP